MKLMQGKVPSNILEKIFRSMRTRDKRVLIGPKVGFDSAVVELDGRIFVVSNDPSSFIPETIPIEYFAFGAVHWPASDVAVFGANPIWMIYTIIFPPGVSGEFVESCINAIYEEAQKIGIDILGGHSGIYKVVNTTVASSTVIGETSKSRLVLPSGAKKGDYILLTKYLGLEIAVALSYGKEDIVAELLGEKTLVKLKSSYRELSVVKEALLLADSELARAMHDVTEGGLATALREIAKSSKLGFEIYREEIRIPHHVEELIEEFHIDLFNTSNTGSLIAAVSPDLVDTAVSLLKRNNIPVAVIGRFIDEGEYIVESGKRIKFPKPAGDNYARIFS